MPVATAPLWPTLTRSYSLEGWSEDLIDEAVDATQLGSGRIKTMETANMPLYRLKFSLRHMDSADRRILEIFWSVTVRRSADVFVFVHPTTEAAWQVRFMPRTGLIWRKESNSTDLWRANVQLLVDAGTFGVHNFGRGYFGV